MRPSSYCIRVELEKTGTALLYHGYSGAVDVVQDHVADFLSDSKRDVSSSGNTLSPETVSLLAERGYLTEKSVRQEREFVRELGNRVHRFSRKHTPAGFLFVPTYSCNLRCPYCYEKSLRRNGQEWFERCMDRDTVDAAFEAVRELDANPVKQKTLSFYGGEPFQEGTRDAVQYIYEEALKKGFRAFSAITNGVDLHLFLDLLGRKDKVGFLQITLDGPPEVHNARRFLSGGHGTFHRICDNIDKALKTGVTVSVRINVDRGNAGGVAELREQFASRGWDGADNFQAYCSPVHGSLDDCKGEPAPSNRFKGHLDMQKTIAPDGACRDGTVEVHSIARSVSKSLLVHMKQQGLPRWKTSFCGSNLAMYLLDAHGDIYPCWETVGRREHRIGRYGPGFVRIERDEAEKWHGRSVTRIRQCVSCRYVFFCGGGCQAFALQKTGCSDRAHCNDFPEVFTRAARMAYAAFLRDGGTPTQDGYGTEEAAA